MTRTGFWIVSVAFFSALGGSVGAVLHILLRQPALSGIVFLMVMGIGLLKIHDLDKRWYERKAGGSDSQRDEMKKAERNDHDS